MMIKDKGVVPSWTRCRPFAVESKTQEEEEDEAAAAATRGSHKVRAMVERDIWTGWKSQMFLSMAELVNQPPLESINNEG